MNKYIISIVIIISSTLLYQCSKLTQEEVLIPDQNFLEALIELGVDRNSDGVISSKEAEKYEAIELWPSNIANLSGIEAFINLEVLAIQLNPLEELDLSSNKSLRKLELIGCELQSLDVTDLSDLRYLDCSGSLAMKSFLTELDVSQNTYLKTLICKENQLQSLDVSQNANLTTLYCGYNSIETIDFTQNVLLDTVACNNNLLETVDVSQNLGLIKLITCGNKLSYLDISANTNLQRVGFDNMPMLFEVCVWTMPFPPAGLVVLMGFSPNVQFSMHCD